MRGREGREGGMGGREWHMGGYWERVADDARRVEVAVGGDQLLRRHARGRLQRVDVLRTRMAVRGWRSALTPTLTLNLTPTPDPKPNPEPDPKPNPNPQLLVGLC